MDIAPDRLVVGADQGGVPITAQRHRIAEPVAGRGTGSGEFLLLGPGAARRV